MKTHRFAKSNWICLLVALLVLLAGCGNTDTAEAQPQVVRKKLEDHAAQANAAPPPAAVVPVPPPSAPAPPQAAPPAAAQAAADPAPAPAAAAPLPGALAVAQAAVAAQPPVAPPPPAARPVTPANPTESQIAALLNIQAPAPYNPKGKIDPFEPLLREEGGGQAAAGPILKKKRQPQSPLEQIDLGQLKLVAIIAALSGNRALVEEASGKGYIVKEGTYIGLNSGKVVAIKLDKVLVEEEYEDVQGKTIIKKKEITLPKPPGEL